jgi:hypothetical protein
MHWMERGRRSAHSFPGTKGRGVYLKCGDPTGHGKTRDDFEMAGGTADRDGWGLVDT